MTNEEFDKVVKERCKEIIRVLSSKAEEYASNDDRMHNFNVAGRVLGTSPEKALFGMLMKHIVSVMDLVDKAEVDNTKGKAVSVSCELIDEKIGDTINYMILLEALLKKRFTFVSPIEDGDL